MCLCLLAQSVRTAFAADEDGMGGDVASADTPVEGAVGKEMEQFAARHVVLGVHDIEIFVDGVHKDAVRQAYLAHLGRGAQVVGHLLVGSDVDDAVTYGVALEYLAPGGAYIV